MLGAVQTETFAVHTGATTITDLTDRAAAFVADRGDGLLCVFVPHATAGLALIETGAGSDADLADLLDDHLLPRGRSYRHAHGSPGHGADHLLPAIISPSLTIPVVEGRLALGTWQSVTLVDPNVDNPDRTVRFSFLG
jgi:secondary thiamine-phosphate synthase enzyme